MIDGVIDVGFGVVYLRDFCTGSSLSLIHIYYIPRLDLQMSLDKNVYSYQDSFVNLDEVYNLMAHTSCLLYTSLQNDRVTGYEPVVVLLPYELSLIHI